MRPARNWVIRNAEYLAFLTDPDPGMGKRQERWRIPAEKLPPEKTEKAAIKDLLREIFPSSMIYLDEAGGISGYKSLALEGRDRKIWKEE